MVRDGQVVEWNDYYAYGAVHDKWSLADGRWKYLGKELDNETATQHLDAREYDGLVGRLWQIDPMWQAYPHQSPYLYANANPFKFSDRSGMASDSTLATTVEEIVVTATEEVKQTAIGFWNGLVSDLTNLWNVTGYLLEKANAPIYPGVNKLGFNDYFGVSTTPLVSLKNIPQLLKLLRGSGPASGVIEISKRIKSIKAFLNYSPQGGIEFVFDAATETFVVGKPSSSLGLSGSPHQRLAQTIGASGNQVVGGVFQRGPNGEIILSEWSGHYYQNWTPQIREQIIKFLESTTGLKVIL